MLVNKNSENIVKLWYTIPTSIWNYYIYDSISIPTLIQLQTYPHHCPLQVQQHSTQSPICHCYDIEPILSLSVKETCVQALVMQLITMGGHAGSENTHQETSLLQNSHPNKNCPDLPSASPLLPIHIPILDHCQLSPYLFMIIFRTH